MLTNLRLHSIADQLVHGPAFLDVILKRVDKLLGGLQSLRITHLRTHTYENLGSHGAIIYGWDIGIDIIRSDGFLMMVHVECGIRGTARLLQMDSIVQSAHLHCSLKGFLDRFDRGPTKETSRVSQSRSPGLT